MWRFTTSARSPSTKVSLALISVATLNYKKGLQKMKLESIPCQKGEPIRISDMLKFSLDAIIYLNRKDKNAVSLHWSDGRERSGVMACALIALVGPQFLEGLLIQNNEQLPYKFMNIPEKSADLMNSLKTRQEFFKINIKFLNLYINTIITYFEGKICHFPASSSLLTRFCEWRILRSTSEASTD